MLMRGCRQLLPDGSSTAVDVQLIAGDSVRFKVSEWDDLLGAPEPSLLRCCCRSRKRFPQVQELKLADLLGAVLDREKGQLRFVHCPKRRKSGPRVREDVLLQISGGPDTWPMSAVEIEVLKEAEAWAKDLSSQCHASPTPRKFHVFINPASGNGQAQVKWQEARDLFQSLPWISFQEVLTTRAGEARDVAAELRPESCDGIVVSGDGMVHEVFNGLASRPDAVDALNIPVGHIPGRGSGNAFAKSILHSAGENYGATCRKWRAAPPANEASAEDVVRAIRSFPRGAAPGPTGLRPDLLQQLTGTGGDEKPAVYMLTNLVNLLADGQAPIGLRPYLGGARGTALEKASKTGGADVCVLAKLSGGWSGRTSFLSLSGAIVADIDLGSESLRFLGGLRFPVYTVYCLLNPRPLRAEISYWPATASTSPLDLSSSPPALDQPLPEGPWVTMTDSFSIFWAINMAAWASYDVHLSPGHDMGSGTWHLALLRNAVWLYQECKAFRLVPAGSGNGNSRETWQNSASKKVVGLSQAEIFCILCPRCLIFLSRWSLLENIFLDSSETVQHVEAKTMMRSIFSCILLLLFFSPTM
eukprot:Skav222744  [mRNA]  locus=scaffold2390:537725:546431:- [translate_table: standard]